ncbi:HAD family phosphatase [Methylobacterium mesophilicum SR1.6/6]|uniref:HAD family phosphatase n=1 Tax=Methylobacterium mesophilicum SR1.6/6 TaxID=908290 RepID=A0A6B9FEM1_9HYPH|nr:HAD family phosphatase [Methylobacterium mesophilicum]QGY01237.1 HAD family phosphatase [Methylobacterium mesophilicum SR1.6/6]
MIKAVIFDMDGVLIDAKDWHYEALNRALGLFGMEISRTDHLTTFDGLPTRRKLELLTATENLPGGLHGFLNRLKQSYTLEIVSTRCRPTFAHEFALARLKARGVKLAVASNSVRDSVTMMMERANLTPHLDLMLSNEDVTRAKPDPEIYRIAMERLGVAPEETLILEDNEHGIKAARQSGAHLLVVQTPADVTLANVDRRIAEIEAAP